MRSHTDEPRNRLTAPSTALAAGLVMALGLVWLPPRWSATMKSLTVTVLRPGGWAALAARDQVGRVAVRVGAHLHTADQLAECRRRLRQLEEENRRLAGQLLLAQDRPRDTAADPVGDLSEPLLKTRCVTARVLGRQARTFLADHLVLDAGWQVGAQSDALVVEVPPGLIDQGEDSSLQPDQLVLSRGRVWGKIVEVGPYTSTVKTVTEPGYRDLVRLAGNGDADGPVVGGLLTVPRALGSGRVARPAHNDGPEGILEGCGEPLARIRLVDVTEPVAVGDAVYSAAGKGLLPAPLLYGHVARLERPVGAAYWEIWIEPAVAPGEPDTVAVLRTELNPLRVAEANSPGTGKRATVGR